jgi:UrcA family protein
MKHFPESLRLTSPAWAALLCLAIIPAAQATLPAKDKKLVGTVRVAYADLDLTRRADVQTLIGRIENAAYRACGGDPRRHSSYAMTPSHTAAVFKECREDAIARAIGAIDAPALSQAHARRGDTVQASTQR